MRKLTILLVLLAFVVAVFGGQIVEYLPVEVANYAVIPFCILIAATVWSLILDIFRLAKPKKKRPDPSHH